MDVFHLFNVVAFVQITTPDALSGFAMTISVFLRNFLITVKHSFCMTKSLVSSLLPQKM